MKNLETLIFVVSCINPQECREMIVDSYNVDAQIIIVEKMHTEVVPLEFETSKRKKFE
jgi:hypothetical protein